MTGAGVAPLVVLLALAFAFGVYMVRIDQRVRATKNQLRRLSITFMKIESDISDIQDSLLVLARGDADAEVTIEKIRERRTARLRRIVEAAPDVAKIMRGLELPDIDDDPAFWAKDRMQKFGFADQEAETARGSSLS